MRIQKSRTRKPVRLKCLLLAADLNNRLATIRAAGRANVMGDMVLAARFTLCQLFECQRILRTALIATAPGMTLLR